MALEEVGQLINLEMRMRVPSNKPPTDLQELLSLTLWIKGGSDVLDTEMREDVMPPIIPGVMSWCLRITRPDQLWDHRVSLTQTLTFCRNQSLCWCWTLHCTEEQDDSLQFSPRPECSLYGDDWLPNVTLSTQLYFRSKGRPFTF